MGANDSRPGGRAGRALLCRVGGRIAALPIEHVIETMRPLPIQPVASRPAATHAAAVLGAAVIRGEAVPVVSAAVLMGAEPGPVGRFVTLSAGARVVALAIDAVLGIETLPESPDALPPLLSESDAVRSIRVLDDALAVVLDAARILPEEIGPANAWQP